MKNKFLKRGYGLMAALVLTVLVAGPHATQASGELIKGADIEMVQPNGGCQNSLCIY